MEELAVKLPVFRTFFRAVGFTIWNGWTIFRLTWFPLTLVLLSTIVPPLLHLSSAGDRIEIPQFEQSLVFEVASIVLQLIATASVAVAIHRVILFGDRQSGHYFLFAFGRTELLYLLMAILSAVFAAFVLAAVLVPFTLVMGGGDPINYFKNLFPKPGQEGNAAGLSAFFVGYVFAWIVTVYFMLRLAVWPPAVVATNRFALGEAWRLTNGNVLRLLGLFLLPVIMLWIPVVLAAGSFYYYNARMDRTAPEKPPTIEQEAPAPQSAPQTNSLSVFQESFFGKMSESLQSPGALAEQGKGSAAPRPLDDMPGNFVSSFFALYLFFLIYATAYGVAILSYSYKALKGYDASEPIPAVE